MNYPIIRHHSLIERYLKGDLPEFDIIQKPLYEKQNFNYWWLLILGLFFGVFTLVILVNFDLSHFLFCGLISFFSLKFFATEYRNYSNNEKKKYDKYIAKLNQYYNHNRVKDELKTRLLFTEKKTEYAKSKIKELSKQFIKPQNSYQTSKKGFSENYFFSILDKHFSGHIFQGQTVYDWDKTFQFIPDIIFMNDKIIIDIEIDEPYVLSSKEPIHYLLSPTNHIDEKRDNFFTEKYWTVIRFSENQVYQEPVSCMKVISNIIFKITGEEKYEFALADKDDLPIEKCWTFEEGQNFAKSDYRQSYLGVYTI